MEPYAVTPQMQDMRPPAEPPGPAVPLRAVAVALLNLSGLGLGYALLRRWLGLALCLAATAGLLLVALPADPDGVPRGYLLGYLGVLALAAVHGAVRGLRRPLAWPPKAPVALLLGLVLLAAPLGAVAYYQGARDDATQAMLLDRLAKADQLVQTAKAEPFGTARSDYRTALDAYRDLTDHHAGSKAARRVPDRLRTYYTTIGAPYDQKHYCDAIEPLKYLRTIPGHYDAKTLGSLAGWPDDRLATSLYECGSAGIAQDAVTTDATDADLADLLTTFPKSAQAAKVEPAVRAGVAAAGRQAGGSSPCPATDHLRSLSARIGKLPGDKAGVAGALAADAHRADGYVQSGTYACGVAQYKSGDFKNALDTMNSFLTAYAHDAHRTMARKVAIAAEIAAELPAAGRHMPTTRSGGGLTITISNDSPDRIEVLYTGPVTGSFVLAGCGSCKHYASESAATSSACKGGKSYPKKTISLPPGTTYFLHKSTGGEHAKPGTDTVALRDGYIYTECAYTVDRPFGL